MHAKSVKMMASAAKLWYMHEVFIKSGFSSELQHVLRSSATATHCPQCKHEVTVWQLEIFCSISHFASVTQICESKDGDTLNYTKGKGAGPECGCTHINIQIYAQTCTDRNIQTCNPWSVPIPLYLPGSLNKAYFLYQTCSIYFFNRSPDLQPCCKRTGLTTRVSDNDPVCDFSLFG